MALLQDGEIHWIAVAGRGQPCQQHGRGWGYPYRKTPGDQLGGETQAGDRDHRHGSTVQSLRTGGLDTHMAINRRFLYPGLFLVALGGVLVAVDLSAVDSSVLDATLRLWPIAIVAIGAGIALRRSRFALAAGVLAAMMPGLVLGGGLALAPRAPGECGSDA